MITDGQKMLVAGGSGEQAYSLKSVRLEVVMLTEGMLEGLVAPEVTDGWSQHSPTC